MSKGQILSSCLLVIFLFLNFCLLKSWSEGVIPIAVTEEIKESAGGEEEMNTKSFTFDIVLTDESGINFTNSKKITNKNYITFQDFKGTFFVPDSYSPPDLV